MPLEPTATQSSEPATVEPTGFNLFEKALLASPLNAPPQTEEIIVAPDPVEVVPVVADTVPDEPMDPMDELGRSDEETKPVLPIEGKTKELSAEIRAGKTIKAMKEEISTTWKPKVAELEQQLVERESRLEELRAQAEEAAQLKEKLESYESEMSVVRLERTPAFIEAVSKPVQEIEDTAKEIAERYGIDADKLFQAFDGETEKERRALLKEATDGLEVDRDDDFELRDLIKRYIPIKAKKNELYDNADKALAELAARAEQDTAAKAAERAVERSKSMDLVAKRITTAAPSLTDFVTKDVINRAKDTDVDALDAEKKAYNHLAGLALPKLEKAYADIITERDNLLDELAFYSKSNPRVTGGAGSSSTTPAQGFRTLAEAAAARMNGG